MDAANRAALEESTDVTIEMDLGLFAAREIWRHQGEEAKELSVALSVPDPETNTQGLLEYEGENPGLLFYKGSINAVLMRGALKVGGFGIALWSGRGLAASQRAGLIVEDMRSKAENIPNVIKLERIDKMGWGQLKGKHAVILFLHGLLSTDVGIFDSLIQILKMDPIIRDRFALIGWPHNSLASIDTNATTLQRFIQKVVGLDGPNVAFVCHSRGGLLARSVAVKLCQGEQKWKEKIRGCVTFGTPHEGAELAEMPEHFFGTLLLVQAWRGGNGFASVSDALYCSKNSKLDGIEDLARTDAKRKTFLEKLLDDEGKLAPEGEERALNILAVGGKAPRVPWLSFWINKALGGAEHDSVVRMESSMPALFRQTQATDCDHFSYFDPKQIERLQDQVIKFLKDVLEWDKAKLEGDKTKSPPPLDLEELTKKIQELEDKIPETKSRDARAEMQHELLTMKIQRLREELRTTSSDAKVNKERELASLQRELHELHEKKQVHAFPRRPARSK